jgi:crotonobetainyl-CoA:carnitine CoA-transferase CaiB-like acyl-CoA transferase
VVEDIFASKPAAYWLQAFEKHGIPAEPINTLEEIMAHPQLALRNMLIEVEYPPGSGNRVHTAGMPWRSVAAPDAVRPPPALGEHTAEVLAEIAAAKPAAYERN